MNLVRSFISTMRTVRDHYKKGDSAADENFTGFNCDVGEVDASLYGFISSHNERNAGSNRVINTGADSDIDNDIDSNKQSNKQTIRSVDASQQTTENTKLAPQAVPIHTEVITIELFEQDNR